LKTLDKYIDNAPYKNIKTYFLFEEKFLNIIAPDYFSYEQEKQVSPTNIFQVKGQYDKVLKSEHANPEKKILLWSGEQVIKRNVNKELMQVIKQKLEISNFQIVFSIGFTGFLENLKFYCNFICRSKIFNSTINTIILINCLILMLDGNYFTNETHFKLFQTTYFFNTIYILEMFIRLFGTNTCEYFKDVNNILHIFIVGLCFLELTSPHELTFKISNKYHGWDVANKASSFRFLKIFRILRLLFFFAKNDNSMQKIIVGIYKIRSKILSFIVLFIVVIIIFSTFGRYFLYDDLYFENFKMSFFSMFYILTLNNWNVIMYQNYKYSPFFGIFCIIWMFVSNFLLLNLCTSIIMDSLDELKDEERINFSQEELLNQYYLEEMKIIKNNIYTKVNIRKKDTTDTHFRYNENKNLEGSSEDSDDDLDLNNYINSVFDKANDKNLHEENIQKLFRGDDCEYSLFIFSQRNPIRIRLKMIVSSKSFSHFILIFIIVFSIRMVVETYFDEDGSSSLYFFIIDIITNIIFIIECIVKVISSGFVFGEGSYLKNNWNKLDFFIVIISVVSFPGKDFADQINALRVFKFLRILKPLRFISRDYEMKLITTSLLDSIKPISSVLIISFVFMIVFSVISINLIFNLYETCYQEYKGFKDSGLIYWNPVKNFSSYFPLFNVSEDNFDQVSNLVLFYK